jgi:hypothetical protein
MNDRVCLARPACASRFSQPPDAFIRPEPAGPISYRIRSWGSALQSFAPLVQPYAVSDAITLMSLDDTPFGLSSNGSNNLSNRNRDPRYPGEPPRLQGLTPHESPPQSVGCLGLLVRVALLGFCPPGYSPSLERPGLHRASPLELSSPGRKRPNDPPFRVSIPARSACLFRDCLPSWASSPSDHHDRLGWTRFGSRLLELRGASPSPCRALFEPSNLPCLSRSS